ncbi:MAG TPA: tripartite tricarboxylate transporter TctB family protein [Devosiaceae bacterium]|jgi:hypothetical protein
MSGKIAIKSGQDLAAGLFFIVAGAAWLWVGKDYPMGTLNNMSSGFLPRVLAAILVFLGLLTAGRSFAIEGPAMERWGWRPLILVIASIVLFGLLIDRVGLVIAGAALIICGSLATRDSRPLQVGLTIVVLIACSVVVFVWGLGLPMQVWPKW